MKTIDDDDPSPFHKAIKVIIWCLCFDWEQLQAAGGKKRQALGSDH